MSDYHLGLERYKPLRNPLDNDEDIKQREKTIFGNPYLKIPKNTGASKTVENSSDMNEAEEEGTHHFEDIKLSQSKKRQEKKKESRYFTEYTNRVHGMLVPGTCL
jgi:hypothetical protein